MDSLMAVVREMLTSKKFLSAVAGMIVSAAAKIGLDLPTEDIVTILSPLMAYILGQGLADMGKEAERIKFLPPRG